MTISTIAALAADRMLASTAKLIETGRWHDPYNALKTIDLSALSGVSGVR